MIKLETNNVRTHIEAHGRRNVIMADLGTIVSAVLEAILADTDDEYADKLCTAANLCLIKSVQNARERAAEHDG